MGKGKGKVIRYCMRVNANYTLFEFSGFSLKYLFRIKKLFNFKLNTRLYIFSTFLYRKNLQHFNNSESFFVVKYCNLF